MDIKATVTSWKWRIIEAGFNQSSFAEELKISKSALSGYLKSKAYPSLQNFEKIENFLKSKGV